MIDAVATAALFLFVPGDRPERWEKALASGADAVIIDLEDAVAPSAKPTARQALQQRRDALAAAPCPVLVRVSARATPEHAADLEAIAGLGLAGLVLAKADDAADVVAAAAATGLPVIALVESAKGLAAARAIAEVASRLAFGSIDFAADLGCAHTRAALAAARFELVLASRLAGRAGPIDGVTATVKDADLIRSDAEYACEIGFAGKLLVHPAQIEPAGTGFAPNPADIASAERILAANRAEGATLVDGAMVDAPVLQRAQQLLNRAARFRTRSATQGRSDG